MQKVTKEAYNTIEQECDSKTDLHSIMLASVIKNEDIFLSMTPVYHAHCRRAYTAIFIKIGPGNRLRIIRLYLPQQKQRKHCISIQKYVFHVTKIGIRREIGNFYLSLLLIDKVKF